MRVLRIQIGFGLLVVRRRALGRAIARAVALGCLLFAAAASHSVGQSADPLAGTKEIEEELRKLDQTAVGKQIAEIERKFNAATEQAGKAREEVQALYFQLHNTQAYKEYQKRREALEDKRDAEWSRERKAMAEAARQCSGSRQDE